MRTLRAVAAGLTLLALVLGVPLLLAATIGNPLTGVPDLLAGRVTDQVVIDLLAAVAWLAWAQFTVAFLVELISGVRRTPVPRRIPGVFSGQQQLARALVTAVLLLGPTLVSVAGPLVQAAAAPAAVTGPAGVPPRPAAVSSFAPVTGAPAAATEEITIGARGARTWWDLAATHLGAGERWRELWELNQGRVQPGGAQLTSPGTLKVGWTVLVPAGTVTADPAPAETLETVVPLAVTATPVTVTVQPGESLAKIATDHGMSWLRLWLANEGSAQPGGARFTDPDEIEPGWTLTVPTVAAPGAVLGENPVTVHPGDTLSQLAVDHGSSVAAVWSANRDRAQPDGDVFTDPDLIEPGWTIIIPEAAPPSTPAGEAPAQSVAAPAAPNPGTPEPAAAPPVAASPAPPVADPADGAAAGGPRPSFSVDWPETDGQAVTPPPAVAPTPGTAPEVAPAAPKATSPASAGAGQPQFSVDWPDAGGQVAVTPPAAAPGGTAADTDGGSAVPVLAAAGGGVLLSGLALSALFRHRRRQFRHRRPGRSIAGTPADLTGMERTLLTTGRQAMVDVEWLDQALRSLVQNLAGTAGARLPEVVAVRMGGDELELVLAGVSRTAPAPWVVDDSGLRWTVRRGDPLGYDEADREWHFAPFPTLASVGYTPGGDHWLVDLEMIGSLSLAGDPRRCLDLARFLAAELSHNSWSEMLQVTLIGFGAEMAAMNPDRLTYAEDLDRAMTGFRVHLDAVGQVMEQAEVDVAAGRLHNIAGDTWAPHVVLIAPEAAVDRPALDELLAAMQAANDRLAVAIVVSAGDARTAAATRWQLRVDEDGVLSIPALDLALRAEQLPESEAAQLAQLMALAAETQDRPVPAARGGQPWDAFADTTGALRPEVTTAPDTDGSPVRLAVDHPRDGSLLPLPVQEYLAAAAVTADDVRTLAPGVSAEVRRRLQDADRTLDEDLADWWDQASRTPKVTVLGPVDVRAQGELDPQRPRRAWNVEVVLYLATRAHGATAEEVGLALWPGEALAHEKSKLRNAVYGARRWLGPNPRTGRDHLPANPGVAGGVYRVQDVLVDSELFRRLRIRALARGQDGIGDLRAALDLVTGVPYDRLRPGGYGWLAGTALDHDCTAMIGDVAHILATHYLAADQPELAVAAAQVALKAGINDDTLLLDAAGGCFALGNRAEGSTYIKRILANHDAGVEEDLPARTYEILLRRGWLPEAS